MAPPIDVQVVLGQAVWHVGGAVHGNVHLNLKSYATAPVALAEVTAELIVSKDVWIDANTLRRHDTAVLYRAATGDMRRGLERVSHGATQLPFSLELPARLPPTLQHHMRYKREGYQVGYRLVVRVSFPAAEERTLGQVLGGRKGPKPLVLISEVIARKTSSVPPMVRPWPPVKRDDRAPLRGKGEVHLDVAGPDRFHIGMNSLPIVVTARLPQLLAKRGQPRKLSADVKIKIDYHFCVGGGKRKESVHAACSEAVPLYAVGSSSDTFRCEVCLPLPNDMGLVTLSSCYMLTTTTHVVVDLRYGNRQLARSTLPVSIDCAFVATPAVVPWNPPPAAAVCAAGGGSMSSVAAPVVPSAPPVESFSAPPRTATGPPSYGAGPVGMQGLGPIALTAAPPVPTEAPPPYKEYVS